MSIQEDTDITVRAVDTEGVVQARGYLREVLGGAADEYWYCLAEINANGYVMIGGGARPLYRIEPVEVA